MLGGFAVRGQHRGDGSGGKDAGNSSSGCVSSSSSSRSGRWGDGPELSGAFAKKRKVDPRASAKDGEANDLEPTKDAFMKGFKERWSALQTWTSLPEVYAADELKQFLPARTTAHFDTQAETEDLVRRQRALENEVEQLRQEIANLREAQDQEAQDAHSQLRKIAQDAVSSHKSDVDQVKNQLSSLLASIQEHAPASVAHIVEQKLLDQGSAFLQQLVPMLQDSVDVLVQRRMNKALETVIKNVTSHCEEYIEQTRLGDQDTQVPSTFRSGDLTFDSPLLDSQNSTEKPSFTLPVHELGGGKRSPHTSRRTGRKRGELRRTRGRTGGSRGMLCEDDDF